MTKSNKIILIIILIIAVGIAGFFIGRQSNQQEIKNLKDAVSSVYQEPPEVMNQISGIVKNIQGATIYLEANNPENYLPKSEKPEKVTKYVSVSENTSIIKRDFTTESDGPEISEISLSDIQEGDEITVQSNENIRTSQKFQATKILTLSF